MMCLACVIPALWVSAFLFFFFFFFFFLFVSFSFFFFDRKRQRQMEGATEDKRGELSMDTYK
jgi:hypothetical protein